MREFTLIAALSGAVALCSSPDGIARPMPAFIDEFTTPGDPAPSVDKVANPAFRQFASATLQSLGGFASSQGGSTPSLTFVRVALAASGDVVPDVPGPPASSHASGCTLRSPWVDASVSEDGSSFAGTVYWNERQILRDRALLEGIRPPAEPPTALPGSTFATMAREYGQSVMKGDHDTARTIPSDVLWLFKRAPQSTRGPFVNGAKAEMQRAAESAADIYGDLVAALLEECGRSAGQSLEFKNITDLRSLFDFERVRKI